MESTTIKFILPSDDFSLAVQVFEHVNNNSKTIDISNMLLEMAKKYRFAGYIGTLDYLFVEIQNMKYELQKTKDELQKVKNKKWSWFY